MRVLEPWSFSVFAGGLDLDYQGKKISVELYRSGSRVVIDPSQPPHSPCPLYSDQAVINKLKTFYKIPVDLVDPSG